MTTKQAKSLTKTDSNKYPDVYRSTYFRYLGYSHEIAEAFGSLFMLPCMVLKLSYGLTSAYILADAGDKAIKENERKGSEPIDVAAQVGKAMLWQLFASLVIPRFVISGVTGLTTVLARERLRMRWRGANLFAAVASLVSIPLIIKPIDGLVDVMGINPNDSHEKKLDKTKSKMKAEGYDIYRDSYLRYLGLLGFIFCHASNEVGEAFRHLWKRHFVHLSYGVAVAYVVADTVDKASKVKQKPGATSTQVAIKAGDVLLWQMLASVVIPGFTINRIAKGTRILVRNIKLRNAKYIPTAVGLGAIPVIIHPIDKLVDYLMDNSYRKYFK